MLLPKRALMIGGEVEKRQKKNKKVIRAINKRRMAFGFFTGESEKNPCATINKHRRIANRTEIVMVV